MSGKASFHPWVSRLRWGLAAAIVAAAAGLIMVSQLVEGYYQDPFQYLMMIVLHSGSIVIPALLILDLLGHGVRSLVLWRQGQCKRAFKSIALTLLVDVLLLGLALVAGLSVIEYRS